MYGVFFCEERTNLHLYSVTIPLSATAVLCIYVYICYIAVNKHGNYLSFRDA